MAVSVDDFLDPDQWLVNEEDCQAMHESGGIDFGLTDFEEIGYPASIDHWLDTRGLEEPEIAAFEIGVSIYAMWLPTVAKTLDETDGLDRLSALVKALSDEIMETEVEQVAIVKSSTSTGHITGIVAETTDAFDELMTRLKNP